MSGHSKWASIKHKKAITDSKKSKVFSKIASLISIAAKKGGDPVMNPNLRLMLEKGKAAGMTKENIDRAIKRGTGELGGAILEEIMYEAYGPGGIGILIEMVTDNHNRTVSEVRGVLNKYNGKMAETGSVGYLFSKKGIIAIAKDTPINDDQTLELIDLGAEDVIEGEDSIIVYCDPHNFEKIKKAIEEMSLKIESSEVSFNPNTTVELDEATSESAMKLLDALDELEDITNIATNAA